MGKLKNFIPPERDEHIASYILRIAEANGITDLAAFTDFVLKMPKYRKHRRLSATMDGALYTLAADMGLGASELLDMYKTMTVAGYTYLFSNTKNQIKRVLKDLNPAEGNIFADGINSLPDADLKVCEECIFEELNEKGYYIIHTSHQLPGVTVCNKHKTPLSVVKRDNDLNLRMPAAIDNTHNITAFDVKYLNYVMSIYDNRPDISQKVFRAVIAKKQNELGRNEVQRRIQEKCELIEDSALRHSLDNDKLNINTYIKKLSKIRKRQLYSSIDYMVALMSLFSTTKEMISALKANKSPVTTDKEEFEDFCMSLQLELISDYSPNMPIVLSCRRCGHQFISSKALILNGWECPYCDQANDKQVIIKRIVDRAGRGEYEILNIGEKITDPLTIQHKTCGAVQKTKLFVFVGKDNKCECMERKANKRLISSMVLSQEEFEKRMQTLHPDIEIEGVYAGRRSALKCTCNICGHTWQTEAGNLLDGKGCSDYAKHPGYRHPRGKTQEEFVEELKGLHPDIEVIGTYVNAHTVIDVKCHTCGHCWKAKPHDLLRKGRHGCPNYRNHTDYKSSQVLSHEQFVGIMADRHPEIKCLSEYKSMHSDIRFCCNECGHVWDDKPAGYVYGKKICPHCGKSKQE